MADGSGRSGAGVVGVDDVTASSRHGRRGAVTAGDAATGTTATVGLISAGDWLRRSRGGLIAIALVVGAGSGLGAVGFRYLIYFFTWLATGHVQFGQQGRVPSAHFPWLGLGFFVVIPVVGGLIYGPLIYRFAREARGHGVPEVMMAVADNGGRIRPQVAGVKALASALCIGAGGSVGREGPIVQIGSAMASSVGQWIRMPENRLRVLVACGAAGGIAATFNAPITGVFFGVEIILRAFSIEAIFTVMLSAMVADVISRQFLGAAPFLSGFPPGIALVPRPQLPARRPAGGDRRSARPGLQERPVQDRGRLRPGLEAPPGMGPARRWAGSPWACCCWPCRKCTGSATRSCTRPWPAATPCGF